MLGNTARQGAASNMKLHRGNPAFEPYPTYVHSESILPSDRESGCRGRIKLDTILLIEIDAEAKRHPRDLGLDHRLYRIQNQITVGSRRLTRRDQLQRSDYERDAAVRCGTACATVAAPPAGERHDRHRSRRLHNRAAQG